MKNRITFFLFLVLPLFSFSQNGFLSKGTIEMGGELSFASQSTNGSEGSSTTFASSVYFGVMIAKNLELGFRPGFTINSYSGSSYKVYDLYFNPSYNFNSPSKIFPYLGFIVGYNSIGYNDQNYGGLGIGGEGGMKFYLNESSLLLFKIEYLSKKFNDVESGFSGSVEDMTVNSTSVGLGFRFFFPQTAKVK
jgi:hypothetical protein